MEGREEEREREERERERFGGKGGRAKWRKGRKRANWRKGRKSEVEEREEEGELEEREESDRMRGIIMYKPERLCLVDSATTPWDLSQDLDILHGNLGILL